MPAKRPRQNPVSCQLCRAKKLRCDRQLPCANCSARGVSCEPSAPPAQIPAANADTTVLTRLEHLEDAVESLRKSVVPQPAAPQPIAALTSEIPQNHDCQPTSHGSTGLKLVPVGSMKPDTRMCLPTKHEAISLFYFYNTHVNYLHHVIHAPSALALIDQIYTRPPDEAEPAGAALLLAMLAGASYLWNPTVGVFAAHADAQHASSVWLDAALEALQQARRGSRAAAVSLEEVQASIIASYLVYNVEGFSPRVRLLHVGALGLARDLGLHRLDAPPVPTPREDRVLREVKRRVWWQIVSLDWLLAFLPGPQEGSYLIQPRHMAVALPQDTDDAHLEQGRPHPPSQPSTMAYFLQRVRLAEICRCIVDADTDARQTDSTALRALDALFDRFFDALPPFFRLDGDDDDDNGRPFPHLSTPRCLIHLGAHTRRSKLHQPWLVRGLHEPTFAFARVACLASSRAVLRVAGLLEAEGRDRAFAPARLCMVVHHVATAAVILVADLSCAKSGGPEEEERRKLEIVGACGMLERAKRESAVAEGFLESVDGILTRHGIQLPAAKMGGAGVAAVSPGDDVFAQGRSSDGVLSAIDTVVSGGPGEAGFGEFSQSGMDVGFNLDVPAWDELFTDLNACPTFNTDLLDFSL